MSIRKIKIEDYQQIKRIEAQGHALHANARPDLFNKVKECDVLPVEYFNKHITNKNNHDFVYTQDNKVLGFVLAFKKPNSPAQSMKKRDVLYVENLVVDNAYQNKGIGKKLMQHLKKVAIKNNMQAMELNVYAFNKNAIAFYEALGMKVKTMVFEELL